MTGNTKISDLNGDRHTADPSADLSERESALSHQKGASLVENLSENTGYLGDDQTLTVDFVNSIIETIQNGDEPALRALYENLHPADQADLFGILNDEQRLNLLKLLKDDIKPETLVEMDADIGGDIVEAIDLETDDAASILSDIDEVRRAEILSEVSVADRLAVRAALEYPEDSAGRLMQKNICAVPAYWSVGQIIDHLRQETDLPEQFYEVFIIDPAYRPIGSVPLSTLLKAGRKVIIENIMDGQVRRMPITMDKEEVAYLFEQYNLISAPVIDDSQRLVGMITVDDVVEIIHEETHEDMLALAGVEADTGLSDTVIETVRSRISWLGINMLTAILASLVIWPFSDTIAAFVPLAVLMPIVASMGGNAGTQTLTVAVRSLATKDLTASNMNRIIWREVFVGALNGSVFAILMGALAALWYYFTIENSLLTAFLLASVIAIAMVINLLAAGLAGILIPISLQRAGYDPAVSSAVFVTTVTDILGFFVFLGLATVILSSVL